MDELFSNVGMNFQWNPLLCPNLPQTGTHEDLEEFNPRARACDTVCPALGESSVRSDSRRTWRH